MSEVVLYLACVVPVICMGVVTLGVCLFSWRVVARLESAHRDMLKAVLVMAAAPGAPQLAGMMEASDAAAEQAAVGKATAEAMNGMHRLRRPAQ